MPTEKGKRAKKPLRLGGKPLPAPSGTSQTPVTKPEAVLREEGILKFWNAHRIFEKSLEARKRAKLFVFYEGPPYANGLPGVHHFLARVFKDIIIRYRTMRGFRVPRRAGWDTHGLPIEMEVEKKLGVKNKKEIEERIGIVRFIEEARANVFFYKSEWEKFTERIAYWLDFEHAYLTMSASYMETLWWIIAEWWKKKLLYQDFKVLPWCTRCGTGLSSHEVAQGYETIVDTSVYIRFKIQSQDPRWKNVALLSWTTTPWTLPGNVALAVSASIQYVRVPDPEKKGNWVVVGRDNFPILAKRGVFPKDAKPSVPFSGSELVGLSYQPLFEVPELSTPQSYHVYAADFVRADEGTGIVHTAVMYGEDDYRLGKKAGLPTIHTVTDAGKFVASLGGGLAGKYVKARETEIAILQHLQRIGSLFREEAYEHEYPFCWRCRTPILYYARSSWWVRVNAVRRELLKNNETINWIPSYLKHGRFGEWLREEKDWAFSRERYWGTTLPLWKCDACGDTIAISSIRELSERAISSGNRYLVMRHGEAENIVQHIASSWPETIPLHLTEQGREQVASRASLLGKVDLIFASDLTRTRETAEIVKETLQLPVVHFDERLREIGLGVFNGKPVEEYEEAFERSPEEKLLGTPEGGESFNDVRKRLTAFFLEQEKNYRGKAILVVTHGDAALALALAIRGAAREEVIRELGPGGLYLEPGEVWTMDTKPLPRNEYGEIDLHRPYVDGIKIRCSCGGIKSRIPEVADVWFDSGAMPFAQFHYPFENRELIDKRKNFPADFISEGVDQTRGWFYTLLAVSTLLEKGAPYKNVISLGHILDKNGQKMSKSRGNVVNPQEIIDRYGVDAIRWYLYTANAPGDPKRFDEKDVLAKLRGFLGTFWNSYIFFETYAEKQVKQTARSRSLLDQWILSRLAAVVREVTGRLEQYDVVGSARLLEAFVVDDFSNWYLRRSRRRFQRPASKRDKEEVMGVTATALATLAKLTAPFVPYLAEAVWRGLQRRVALTEESVHITDWLKSDSSFVRWGLEANMATVRAIAAEALAQRANAKVKVRQPLSTLTITHAALKRYPELVTLIKDEANVKNIVFAKDHRKRGAVVLDTKLTETLRQEGLAREIIRNIQEMRRDLGLTPRENIRVQIMGDPAGVRAAEEWGNLVRTEVNAKTLSFGGKKQYRIEREVPSSRGKVWIGIR